MDGFYGKLRSIEPEVVVMEYGPFSSFLGDYLPSALDENLSFKQYLKGTLAGNK